MGSGGEPEKKIRPAAGAAVAALEEPAPKQEKVYKIREDTFWKLS